MSYNYYVIPLTGECALKLVESLDRKKYIYYTYFSYSESYYLMLAYSSLNSQSGEQKEQLIRKQVYDDLLKKGYNVKDINHFISVKLIDLDSQFLYIDQRFSEINRIAKDFIGDDFGIKDYYIYLELYVKGNNIDVQYIFAFLKLAKVIVSPTLEDFPIIEISNLPKNIKVDNFLKMNIKYFKHIVFENIKIFKGTAYCLLKTNEMANKAIKLLNGAEVDTNIISAKHCEKCPLNKESELNQDEFCANVEEEDSSSSSSSSNSTKSKQDQSDKAQKFEPPARKPIFVPPSDKAIKEPVFIPPPSDKAAKEPAPTISPPKISPFTPPSDADTELTSPTVLNDVFIQYKPPSKVPPCVPPIEPIAFISPKNTPFTPPSPTQEFVPPPQYEDD